MIVIGTPVMRTVRSITAGIATELPLPVAVAQDDDRMRARAHVVAAADQAAEVRLDPKHLEVAAAHELADGGRAAALRADRDPLVPDRAAQHVVEHIARFGEFAKEGVVESGLIALFEVAALSTTSRPGSRTGSSAIRIWWTTLNMAVFAPMPRARVAIATVESAGLRWSWRIA